MAPISPGDWAIRCYRAALLSPDAASIFGSAMGLVVFIALGIAVSMSLVRSRAG